GPRRALSGALDAVALKLVLQSFEQIDLRALAKFIGGLLFKLAREVFELCTELLRILEVLCVGSIERVSLVGLQGLAGRLNALIQLGGVARLGALDPRAPLLFS